MFFMNRLKTQTLSMDKAEQELRSDPDIILIDVRTPEEYRMGHIPGSQNIPLQRIEDITDVVMDQNARIFTYCLSGARSGQACEQLARLGYTNVTNIGGISRWKGEVETALSVAK